MSNLMPTTQTSQNSKSGDNDMFYDLCLKEKTCGNKVTCFKFKSRNHCVLFGFFSLMCTALLVAVILPLIINALLDDTINEQVVIDSTSAPNYESWQTNAFGSGKDDLQIMYKLRFFDVQNPQGLLKGEKPVVVEVGPYTYNEYFYKFDISWDDHGDTVTYNTQRYYVFNQEASGAGLKETDTLTLVYPTAIGFEFLLGKVEKAFPGINALLDSFILMELNMAEAKAHALIEELYLQAQTLTPAVKKNKAIAAVLSANHSINVLFADLDAFILRSNGLRLLLKTLMCGTPAGVSPFYQIAPGPAWFGYPKDDLLVEMIPILNKIAAKTHQEIPWSVAVPGPAINYTSIDDARRRRNFDTLKTGKKNPNQVSRYVRYQNMTTYHTCVLPANSPQQPGYIQGVTFPACAPYQYEWTEAVAEKMGYTLPFATDYANRIEGSDANMYGRPMRSPKQQVFVSDIYRGAYILHYEDQDWYGVKVQAYQIQTKDLYNVTMNPENAQYYSFGPSGVLNATQAAGIPVFISYPHFYLGDPRLVAAVKGLSPNPDAHESTLLMEPQTGLMVSAKKRLQVNYLVDNYYLPEANQSSIALAESACLNIETAVGLIGSNATVNCTDTLLIPLITCLAIPSNWTLSQSEIFFPYGWVAEEFELPASDANDLKNSLLMVNSLSSEIRFWSLIIAGFCFAAIVAMLGYNYYKYHEDKLFWEKYRYQQGAMNNPTGEFTFHPDHGIISVQPLLGGERYNNVEEDQKSIPQDSYAFSG